MKLLLTILAYLMPLFAFAETTTDRLTISSEPLQLGGGEVKVTVSLEGSRIYTGYEMDITLPEGIELNYYKGAPDVARYSAADCIYPFTEDRDGNKTFTHTVTASYGEVAPRTIRIACISTSNENFKSNSGKLLTIYLKASAFAKPGDVSIALSNCKFATFDDKTMTTTGYVPEQTEISGITVVNNPTALASPNVGNTSADGCYTLDGIKVKQVRKGSIYIYNGKKVIR